MTSRLVILHDIKYKILDRYLKMNYKKDMFTSNVGYVPKKKKQRPRPTAQWLIIAVCWTCEWGCKE